MRNVSNLQGGPSLIDSLTESVAPVSRRRPGREMMILLAVLALQLVGSMAVMSDSAQAVFTHNLPMATAKALVFFGLAMGFGALAFRSFEPTSARHTNLALAIGGLLATFGVVMLDKSFGGGVMNVLKPANGVVCVVTSVSFSIPLFVALTMFMRGAAPTRPNMTALFIGVASGSWGAFLYSLQCPFMNVAYVATWYGGAVAVSTLVAALVLPRLARW